MNKTNFLWVLVFCWVFGCKEPYKTGLAKTSLSKVDPIVEKWLGTTGIPSLSYVLVKDGNLYRVGTLGYANLKSKILADTTTIYSTGSNFKSVTATAIMQLHDKGMLDIEAPINKYLKNPVINFDETKPIRVKHLMSHQSGIPTSFRSRKLWARNVKDLSFDDISKVLKPNARPETVYQYCNDCFALLGEIIENVSGQRYEDYVFKNVLKPLGITTYGFSEPSAEMIEDMALPYHMRYNRPFPMDFVRNHQYPSGDMYLKPTDMAKFLLMHLNKGVCNNKRLLSEKSVEMMHRPQIKAGDHFYYGLGFGIEEMDGKHFSFHQGSMPGYLSVFRMDPDSRSVVYIATNVTASPLQEKQLGILLEKLFRFVMEGSISEEMDIPMEEKRYETSSGSMDLDQYVGQYKIEGAAVSFGVEEIGHFLYLINPDGQRFRLEYLGRDRFYLTTENEDVEFIVGANGSIQGLIFFSGNKKIEAHR